MNTAFTTLRRKRSSAMGVGRIFSREGPIVDFPGAAKNISAGGKSGKISF